MEFLRQLVFDRPNFTNTFINFESVGELPEDEVDTDEEVEEEEEEYEDNEASIVPSQSLCSTVSATSSACSIDKRLLCGVCKEREKDTVIQCGHSMCSVCFDNLKEARKMECAKIRSKVERLAEEKVLKCPFDVCGKRISDDAHKIMFDV